MIMFSIFTIFVVSFPLVHAYCMARDSSSCLLHGARLETGDYWGSNLAIYMKKGSCDCDGRIFALYHRIVSISQDFAHVNNACIR